MYSFALGGKRELGFDQGGSFIGLSDRETEPVPIRRPGANVPEFRQVLRSKEKLRPACPKTIRILPNRSIFRAARLYETEQNVRVEQVGRSEHSACSP
jgi:hypothetical protein